MKKTALKTEEHIRVLKPAVFMMSEQYVIFKTRFFNAIIESSSILTG